jgi:pimeloyl-ACP methyl ester carboxylesterase
MQVVPRRIVLLDPVLRIPPAAPDTEHREAMKVPLGKPRAELEPMLREAHPQWRAGDVHWKAEALEKATPAAVDGVFGGNADVDLIPRLAAMRVSWLVIAADPAKGGVIPPELQLEVEAAARVSGGQVAHMPGVGHDIYREDFEGVMKLVSYQLSAIS